MTNHELLSALALLVEGKDLTSSLALADALEEAGLSSGASILRKGMIEETRIILPKECEWADCGKHPVEFLVVSKEHHVPGVEYARLLAFCEIHAVGLRRRYASCSDSNGVSCGNCGVADIC